MPKVNGGPHSTARTRGSELRQRDMTSLFAFRHHIAAFSLVAALTVELVFIKDDPTLEFRSWRVPLQQQLVPAIAPAKLRAIRTIIHWELIGVVLLISERYR